MKYLKITALLSLTLTLTHVPAYSAEVIKALPDNTVGKGVGGTSTMLIGGAIAGPIGAAIGGIAGIFIGEQVQQSTGQSSQAYQVKLDDGSIETFRSPNYTFNVGDKVNVSGIRIYPQP